MADKKLAHIVLQTGQLTALRDWYLVSRVGSDFTV